MKIPWLNCIGKAQDPEIVIQTWEMDKPFEIGSHIYAGVDHATRFTCIPTWMNRVEKMDTFRTETPLPGNITVDLVYYFRNFFATPYNLSENRHDSYL